MKELFSLGKLYPSDFLKPGEEPRCPPVEMKLMQDENGLVRLEKTAPAAAMYGRYWYRSGINATMRMELQDIVDSIVKVYGNAIDLSANEIWLDIACNDGTLLSKVPQGMWTIGIDPADDSYKKEAENHGHIIQDYFSAEVFKKHVILSDVKVKVITSIAMFYDLEDPVTFIKDVHEVLHDDGLWVMQLSYTPLMLQQLAFDNICHEHIYYYDLMNLAALLETNGFKVMDCQLNDVNGGSFRLYIMKAEADFSKFRTQPYRDVCQYRMNSILSHEDQTDAYQRPDYDEIVFQKWKEFFQRIKKLKKQTVDFITKAKSEGKTIWGYGASTKGNTLLQYFGLDNTLIDGIAERSEYKFGLRTVGTNIPIFSEADMRKAKPDYLLVLPWHFINEFVEREKDFLNAGGKFIVPCPKFQIIGK